MKKSVRKNYLYNLGYQILIIILPLITTPYLSRNLGAEGIGVYSYTISIVTYFILFGSLGLSMYGQREIALKNTKEEKSRTFFELFFLKAITLTIAMILFYFIYARSGEYSAYYKILVLEIISNILDITWFYQGVEEFKTVVIRNTIIRIIAIICMFVFIKTPEDAIIYTAIYVGTNFIGNLLLWFNLKKYIHIVKIKISDMKRHIIPILLLFIPQIAIQIYTVIDKTMLGNILNDMNSVGYYEQSQKIVKMVLTIVTSLSTVMIPRISNLYFEKKYGKLNEYLSKIFRFVWFIGTPLMFGLIGTSSTLVPWFFGAGFDEVKILICIFSPIVLAIGLNNVIGIQYLISTKKQNKFTLTVTIGAISNIILNLLLIPNLGAAGASIASVASETIILLAQIVLIYKYHYFDLKIIFKYWFKYTITSLIMCFIVIFIGNILHPTISTTALQVATGGLFYMGVMYLTKDEFLMGYINDIKIKFKKRK